VDKCRYYVADLGGQMNKPWARYVLAGAAVLFVVVAVTVHFWKLGTSVTIVSSNSPAAVRTTTVHAAGSDAFQLGMLGFAAVFGLSAIFFSRLSSITLPGGIGIKLTPEQKQQASQALARQVSARANQPAAKATTPGAAEQLLRQQPAMLRLPVMAAAPAATNPAEVVQATSDTVELASMASQHTTDLAETLLRLARTSPEALRVMATEIGIPENEWSQLLTGVIPGELWDRLASRALDRVTAPGQPAGRG
jgi:hypothetical protein